MKELVFIEPNKIDSIPFTTSKVIAEFSKVEHRKIKNVINKHKNKIDMFGLSTSYEAESTGGRPEIIYKLNEQQATFIITLLKNTDVVVDFKHRLVEEFYRMKKELMKRNLYREQLKPVRRELTDVIKDHYPNDKYAYSRFTDLSYMAVTGKISRVIRKERGANRKDNAVDYMTADELDQVTKKNYQIAMLIDLGMGYYQIKDILLNGQTHFVTGA
jgi:Uncharacterized phage-encoded protein